MAEAETSPFQGVNVAQAAEQIGELNLDDFTRDANQSNRDRLEEGGDDVETTEDQLEGESEEEIDAEAETEDEVEVDETEAEADSEESETDDETDEDSSFIRNLGEFSEATEIPMEDLLALEMTFPGADGQEETRNLEELRDSFYREADYTRDKQGLADEKRTFASETQEARDGYERNNAVLAGAMQQLQQLFLNPPETAEMERMRVEDPSEWNARMTEYQQRVGHFNQIVSGAAQQYDQYSQTNGQELQGKVSQYMQEQNETLSRDVPGWGEAKKAELTDWAAKTYGFSSQEMEQTLDARTLKLAIDAKKFHDGQSKVKATKQKLSKVPKIAKPGKKKARSRAQLSADQVRSVKGKARTSGKVGDAAAAIEQTIQDWG